jgi:RNA polymerase sigma factor (sigma-70 family)
MNNDTVLYVEDEEDYQMLVQRILGKEGFDIHIASSGEEGLRALEKQRPGLLILDVNLPDTDGYSLCSRLRKHPEWSSLPVLMLTVRRRPEEWLRGFSAGANDYVAKPLNPPELVDRVRSCLAGRLAGEIVNDEAGAEYLLIQAAWSGNRTAYEVLIRKYKQRLMDSLRASGKSAVDAEDAASVAFTKAYQRLNQFRGESSFYTWLYRIAFNGQYKQRRFQGDSIEELTQKDYGVMPNALAVPDRVADDLSQRALHAQIHQAVSVVPRPYRKMLKWHFVKGLSYQTMARKLKIPEGTVMSRLHKAKQLLRRSWNRNA